MMTGRFPSTESVTQNPGFGYMLAVISDEWWYIKTGG